jgi:hypothetical protein
VFRATVSSRTPLRVPTKAGRVYLGATSTVRRSQEGTPVALKGAAIPPLRRTGPPSDPAVRRRSDRTAAASSSQADRGRKPPFSTLLCPTHSSPPARKPPPSCPPCRSSRSSGGHRREPRSAPADRPFFTNQAPNRTLEAHRTLPHPPSAGIRRSPAGIATGPPLAAPQGPHCKTEVLSEGLTAKG